MEPLPSSVDLLALEINPVENREGNFEIHTKIFFESGSPGNTEIIESLSSLNRIGQDLRYSGKIKDFRLRLIIKNDSFFIAPSYDNSSHVLLHESSEAWSLFRNRSNLFTGLTQREKQLLCFIYRGYKQSHIAFIYGISLETFKRHRKNIYKKMQFHSRLDLYNWCEKFLPDHFEAVRNLAVQ
ncbi:MAG: helix-turn-helix transcriptional regulator [Bacteroidetes bacterium]|nr:helix-turn-helix transcriptional regulator [Bacteroidota bacterium]MBP6402832.1 helix-turn-helix transcriptional regulator [Bacteroidia bacterium]MBK9524492.1 helix-turn-helix transcriptional regulator [Bacteroidota bacterium]MBK9542148.1 helix-turn-helix transcriptional regulator [Bacteroidota bacterium]MBL0256363.1 helix-turn-helix transcriptional regulator [Bacteroidota bacterium]